MANPAEASARWAGNPTDEEERPNIELIEQWIAHSGAHWTDQLVEEAKKDILDLIAEIRRLRSLAGIVD